MRLLYVDSAAILSYTFFGARDLESRAMTGLDRLAKDFLLADAKDYALFSGFTVVFAGLGNKLAMTGSLGVLCG